MSTENRWLMARFFKSGQDTAEELRKSGFTDIEGHDELFYTATPPPGWSRRGSGGLWTTFKDSTPIPRFQQYEKKRGGAVKDAFLKKM